MHAQAQNACIPINQDVNSALFELFELSPCDEDAMGRHSRPHTELNSRLRRLDPEGTFKDDAFRSSLAETIFEMGHPGVAEMKPKLIQAGHEHVKE
jgi:hypothetical protein